MSPLSAYFTDKLLQPHCRVLSLVQKWRKTGTKEKERAWSTLPCSPGLFTSKLADVMALQLL